MTNQYVGAKRYKLTSGHSDDAGLGGEGYMVRMSDHYPSFDTAQKWVKAEDYDALLKRLAQADAAIVELTKPVEPGSPPPCLCATIHHPTCAYYQWNLKRTEGALNRQVEPKADLATWARLVLLELRIDTPRGKWDQLDKMEDALPPDDLRYCRHEGYTGLSVNCPEHGSRVNRGVPR